MSINNAWDSQALRCYKTVEGIQARWKMDDITYMRHHPEIRAMIRVFLQELIHHKPKNIFKFAAELFSCADIHMLSHMINQQLKKVNQTLEQSRHAEFDVHFDREKESKTSLMSKSSMEDHTAAIIRFALISPICTCNTT